MIGVPTMLSCFFQDGGIWPVHRKGWTPIHVGTVAGGTSVPGHYRLRLCWRFQWHDCACQDLSQCHLHAADHQTTAATTQGTPWLASAVDFAW